MAREQLAQSHDHMDPFMYRIFLRNFISFFSLHLIPRTHNQPPIPHYHRMVGHIGVLEEIPEQCNCSSTVPMGFGLEAQW